jgi:hypothetical protein
MASAVVGAHPPSAGAAGARRALEARAAAQGVRVRYTVPAYLVVEEFMDAGGPVAESLVDSTGRARSLASFPYPGETVVTVNGAASVLGGVPVPPLYPLYANADYPVTERSEVTDPTGSYLLRAVAGRGTADGLATARSGGADGPVASVTAQTAAVLDEEATTTVTAETSATGLAVGDVLRIASVKSRSVTRLGVADQAPAPTTELVVEGARVGGQAVTIGPDGVHAVPGGTGGSQPSQDPGGALKQAGIRVRTVSAEPVQGGAAADMLEITSVHTLPVAGAPQGTFVWRFGGATTSIRIGAEEAPETNGGSAEGGSVAAPAEKPVDHLVPVGRGVRSGIGAGTAPEPPSPPSPRPAPGAVVPGSIRSEGSPLTLVSSSRDRDGSARGWPLALAAWAGLGSVGLRVRRTRGASGRWI